MTINKSCRKCPERFSSQKAVEVDPDFISQVDLFRARTALSICYYLMKVGMGGSENLWLLVEAGQILTHLSVRSMGTTPVIEKTGEKRKSA